MRRVRVTECDFTNANLSDIVWNEMETNSTHLFKGHSDDVNSVVFLNSGEYFISGR